jgi:ketosteroid isomerase-like protein
MTVEHHDVEVVRELIARVGQLDVEAALELVADDFVLELPFRGDGGPRRLEGDAARRFVRAMPKLFATLPFRDVVVHGALPTGPVVAEYASDGTTHSGRPYRNAYIALFWVSDGRIATWREYFDPTVVAAAFSPE